MDIEIIEAKGSDIQAAAELALKIWEPMREVFKAELGEEIYQAFFKDWRDEKKKAVTEELSSGKGYVAKHASRIVGFISYGTNGNTVLFLQTVLTASTGVTESEACCTTTCLTVCVTKESSM